MKPKQFLRLTNNTSSILQNTITRLDSLNAEKPILVCNEQHRFLVAEQLREIGIESPTIILEPIGKNTAPAIAIAALHSLENGADPVLLVLAADHHIDNDIIFCESIRKALPLAEAGKLVTFGIQPSKPETGYGYIEKGAEVYGGGFKVNRFIEKPDQTTAEHYLAEGNYFWNSGIFMFRASKYIQELELFEPLIASSCNKSFSLGQKDLHFIRVDEPSFSECTSKSIDYAVMEKTSDAVMIPLNVGWSDIGSWSALSDVSESCKDGNVLKGDVIVQQSENSYIYSESRLIAAVGIKDLVIVETKDAILVAHKGKVQDVKNIVEHLKCTDRQEHMNHREVYRPWGVYDSVDNGQRYQVKRITVKPGAKLSVQMHHHRAEHWIVVSGTAKVTNGEKTYLVTENQSTYIPIGQVHALENPGVIPLELIEVQSGSYLGEDDIVRFEDKYGRI